MGRADFLWRALIPPILVLLDSPITYTRWLFPPAYPKRQVETLLAAYSMQWQTWSRQEQTRCDLRVDIKLTTNIADQGKLPSNQFYVDPVFPVFKEDFQENPFFFFFPSRFPPS